MKKTLLIFALILCFSHESFTDHLKGGFFTYEYLGQGSQNTSFLKYRVTLTVYMACNATPAQINGTINFTFRDAGTSAVIQNEPVNIRNQYNLSRTKDEECITDDQRGCYYHIVVYQLDSIELPDNGVGYTVAYQRCCRIVGINNMPNSPPSNSVGNTYAIQIPGSNAGLNAHHNKSAVFLV